LKPDDGSLRSVVESMAEQAGRDASSAREDATRAEAPRLASSTYEEAVKRERAGQAMIQARRHPVGIRGLWEARDLFTKAAGEARQAAETEAAKRKADQEAAAADAQKAQAAAASKTEPPARADPPPVSTAPAKPETKPAPGPARVEPGASRPASPVDERANIERTFRQYEAAFGARDLQAVQQVMALTEPQVRDLQQSFSQTNSMQVTVQTQSLNISPDGNTATVTAMVRRVVALRAGGGKRERNTPTVFTLQKRGEPWVIVSVAAK